jgi:D-3-phosphoglycerate dehydrogenase
MPKHKILITSSYAEKEVNELREKFDVTFLNWMDRGHVYVEDELIELIPDMDAVIVEFAELKNKVVEAAKKLKLVACARGLQGNDSTIALDVLTERNIPVLFAPGRNSNSVAELTILLTLSAMKKIKAATKWLYDGKWNVWLDFYVTFRTQELLHRQVGLIGFGNIGKRVAKLFQAFGANVSAYDPYIDDITVYENLNVKKASLEDILRISDIVSLHMNVSKENIGFIDAEKIALMKPTSLLINSARAVLVDHDALYDALKNHRIAGAALDVFHIEPANLSNEPLLSLDNVFATPHLGGTTEEVIKNHSQIINKGIFSVLENKIPEYVLNPEIFGRIKGVFC